MEFYCSYGVVEVFLCSSQCLHGLNLSLMPKEVGPSLPNQLAHVWARMGRTMVGLENHQPTSKDVLDFLIQAIIYKAVI